MQHLRSAAARFSSTYTIYYHRKPPRGPVAPCTLHCFVCPPVLVSGSVQTRFQSVSLLFSSGTMVTLLMMASRATDHSTLCARRSSHLIGLLTHNHGPGSRVFLSARYDPNASRSTTLLIKPLVQYSLLAPEITHFSPDCACPWVPPLVQLYAAEHEWSTPETRVDETILVQGRSGAAVDVSHASMRSSADSAPPNRAPSLT